MIQLAGDCLIFRTPSGEAVPHSVETIHVELSGENAALFDSEFIRQAAGAVLHYFRDELGRQSVTMAEFSMALENVLRGFKMATAVSAEATAAGPRVVQTNLLRLADESDCGGELLFFPRLREELRARLRETPQMLCFKDIHHCVKKLTGARRWSQRCQSLHDQIVEYLRSCMFLENPEAACALVVR